MPTVMINGTIRQYDKGTTYETIVKEYQPKYNNSIALVYFNGKMRELSRRLEKDGALSFITTSDNAGHNAYVRTAQMMLIKAASESWERPRPAPPRVSRSSSRSEMHASAASWAGSARRRSWRVSLRSGCA